MWFIEYSTESEKQKVVWVENGSKDIGCWPSWSWADWELHLPSIPGEYMVPFSTSLGIDQNSTEMCFISAPL